MRTSKLHAATAVLILIPVAACGAENESAPEEPSETQTTVEEVTRSISLTLTDNVPMDGWQNIDDVSCSTEPFTLPNDPEPQTPQVVVLDDTGTIVAVKDVTETGEWLGNGCSITTEIADVPNSDFYKIEFTSPYGEVLEHTLESGDADRIETEIEF